MTEQKQMIDMGQLKSFAWIATLMFAGYIAAWGINQNWMNQRFDTLQSGEEKEWAKISSVETKLDGVQAKEVADYVYLLQNYNNKGRI